MTTLRCDCGNIEIEAPSPQRLTECDCDICRRYHPLWAYYSPAEVDVRIAHARLDHWQRADHVLTFWRCGDCGCVTHYETRPGEPDPQIAANFRMAEPPVRNLPARRVHNRTR